MNDGPGRANGPRPPAPVVPPNDPLDETICDRAVPAGPGEDGDGRAILLVVIAGAEVDFGRHFVVDKETATIGRGGGNDLVLHDGKVSKDHCILSVVRGRRGVERIDVRDLGTTNGTSVNGEPVDQATLKAGDKVQVGDTVLQLRYGDEIEREYHARLFDLAVRDGLTGLYNKRYVLNELENLLRIARRGRRALSVILLDSDDFKRLNDRFGHLAGDEYLQSLAGLIRGALREQDLAGRVGGEEFLVVLPETGLDGALQLAERLRRGAEEFVPPRGGTEARVTLSAGVCPFNEGVRDLTHFLELADRALYRAKQEGKNRVVAAEDPGTSSTR